MELRSFYEKTMLQLSQNLMTARLYSYKLNTSSKHWPVRQGLILQWNEGWGEAAPLPGFSFESFEEAREEMQSLLPRLSSAKAVLPSVAFCIAAAAIPFSLNPLRIPLCLLNEPRPGFPTLKLKLGGLPVNEAVARVKTYQGAYHLRLDCNRLWTLEEALYFTSHFTPNDFAYLEEPVNSFSDLIRFSEMTGFPIALDESALPMKDLHTRLSAIPTLKAIIIKPTLAGPPLKLETPVPQILSSSYESSIGLLQIARLANAETPPIGLDTFRFFQEDLLTPPLQASEGFLNWSPTHSFPIDTRKLCFIASAP